MASNNTVRKLPDISEYKNKKSVRKLPNDEQTISDRSYSDILYAYLQILSEGIDSPNEREFNRKLDKSDINTKEICQILGVKIRSYQDKMLKLKNLGLIKEENRIIYLKEPISHFQIPLQTLQEMIYISNSNVIKIYIILGNLMEDSFDNEPLFSYEYLAKGLGYANGKYKGVRDMLKSILKGLVLLGLIEYHEIIEFDEIRQIPVQMKKLTKINLHIKDLDTKRR